MKNLLARLMIFFLAGASTPGFCATDFSNSSGYALSLESATELWRKNNIDLKLAADQVQGALADKTVAAQRPIPTLSLNTTSVETGNPDFIKGADSVARIDQIIERGNKRGLRVREANLRSDAAQAAFEDARRIGEVELASRYYDLLLAQQQMRIAEENAELFKQSVDAAERRVRAGDLASADLARLRVDALRAQNDVDTSHNALIQARTALVNYLAMDKSTVLVAVDNWHAAKSAPTLAQIDALVARRSDVIAADKRAEAAAAAFEQAQALRTRDVTVGVQVEHNGQNRPLNTVGVGISVPLSTGSSYSGEIARARAELSSAQRLAEQTRNRAATEIANAQSDVVTALNQLKRFDEQLLDAAAHARDAAELGYRHGALPLMDVLDARRTYKATQMDAAAAHANYAKALAMWNSFFDADTLSAANIASHRNVSPVEAASIGTTSVRATSIGTGP